MRPEAGVPRLGATSVGPFANTAAPVPVSSVNAAARFALVGVARNVPTPVPNPVNPDRGEDVAAIVPVPVTPSEPPVPTNIAAVVFVPLVKSEKAELPAEHVPAITTPLLFVPMQGSDSRLVRARSTLNVCWAVQVFAWARLKSSVVAPAFPPTKRVPFGEVIASPPPVLENVNVCPV
jgi:hypothetical protein